MKVKNGFSLFETLMVLTVMISMLTTLVFWYSKYEKSRISKEFGNDIALIINGIDRRIFIDGYNYDLWNEKEWNGKEDFVENFLKKELIAKLNECGKGDGWVPQIEKESKVRLINCNMWTNKTPFNMNVNAKVFDDGTGFLNEFHTIYYLENNEEFEENFLYLRKILIEAKRTNFSNITGTYNYSFAKVNNPTEELTTLKCLEEKSNCGIKASFNRNGGYEYLRVDGTNSMIDSHVTFKMKKNDERLLCSKWRQDEVTKNWIFEEVNCGIGVQSKDGSKKGVEAMIDYSTQEMVLLDRQCNVYKKDIDNLLIATGELIPCGFSKEEFGG